MIYSKKNLLLYLLAAKPTAYPHLYEGIHITEKFMEVTDGHYVVRVSCPQDGNGVADIPKNRKHLPFKKKRLDACVGADAIRSVLEVLPKGKYNIMAFTGWTWIGRGTNKEETEFITSDGERFIKVSAKNESFKFPQIDSMVKSNGLKRKPKMKIGFSPSLMGKLCDYLNKIGATGVELSIYNEVKPMKMTAEVGGQEVFIILAPTKISEKPEAPQGADDKLSESDVNDENRGAELKEEPA